MKRRNRRILLLNEEVERSLSTICEAALKFSGMNMACLVADIAHAIRDEDDEEEEEEFYDE